MIVIDHQIVNSEHSSCCNFDLSEHEKKLLLNKFATELPALRGKIRVSQGKIAESIGIARQTYNAYETMTRPIPWNVYLALLFYFDSAPATHNMLRQLNLLPMSVDEGESQTKKHFDFCREILDCNELINKEKE